MNDERLRIIGTVLSKRPRGQSLWPALYTLALFLLLSLADWDNLDYLSPYLTATRAQVYTHHQFWRIFTSLGVHADMGHLLGNTLFFVPFAWFLNSYFGFFVFPVLSIFAGALTNLIVLYFYPADVGLIGASGMVYFMVSFWLVLYIGIERVQSVKQRILRSMGLVLAELAPQAFDPQVSYASHAVGLLLGIVFGIIYFKLKRDEFRKSEEWVIVPPDLNPEELEIIEQ